MERTVTILQHRSNYTYSLLYHDNIKNGAFRDAVHRHHQGVLYVQNIALFRDRRLNVITFTAIKKRTALPVPVCWELGNAQQRCVQILYRTAPKYHRYRYRFY